MRVLAGSVGAAVLALAAAAGGAAAQERPGAVYLFGGLVIAHQVVSSDV